jgi:hypothetical protein
LTDFTKEKSHITLDLDLMFTQKVGGFYEIMIPLARWDGDVTYRPYSVAFDSVNTWKVGNNCGAPDLNELKKWEVFRCKFGWQSKQGSQVWIQSLRKGETVLIGEPVIFENDTPYPDRIPTTKAVTKSVK